MFLPSLLKSAYKKMTAEKSADSIAAAFIYSKTPETNAVYNTIFIISKFRTNYPVITPAWRTPQYAAITITVIMGLEFTTEVVNL